VTAVRKEEFLFSLRTGFVCGLTLTVDDRRKLWISDADGQRSQEKKNWVSARSKSPFDPKPKRRIGLRQVQPAN
jgi:hypothetical protein